MGAYCANPASDGVRAMRKVLTYLLLPALCGCGAHEAPSYSSAQMQYVTQNPDIVECRTYTRTEKMVWQAISGAGMGVAIGGAIGFLVSGFGNFGNIQPALWQGSLAGGLAGGAAGAINAYNDPVGEENSCDTQNVPLNERSSGS